MKERSFNDVFGLTFMKFSPRLALYRHSENVTTISSFKVIASIFLQRQKESGFCRKQQKQQKTLTETRKIVRNLQVSPTLNLQ